MEVIGRIKDIDETKSFGANGFRKREVVVTTTEQYPQHILIEFTQDKCDLVDNFAIGESVKVSINLRGREWINPQGETKYFNSIQGWRIEKDEPAHGYQPQQQTPQGYGSPAGNQNPPQSNFKEDDESDLPF